MRIVFAGTPEIAVPALEKIAAEYNIIAVLTGMDKQAGRGKKVMYSPVKTKALELGLTIHQPEKFDEAFCACIAGLAPDLLVTVAYWKIFPRAFLDIFPRGGINLHPSLLPKFRGASPIPATILAGETEGGITIQKMALKMDAGDILLQERMPLAGTETTAGLSLSCGKKGADMIMRVLPMIKAGTSRGVTQDHTAASYCKLIKKEEGLIKWQEPAVQIERKVRAFTPWPRAFTFFKTKRLVICRSTLYATDENSAAPGAGFVIKADPNQGLLVSTGQGILVISRLQLQAKKEMDFKAFLNGHPEIIGSYLGE